MNQFLKKDNNKIFNKFNYKKKRKNKIKRVTKIKINIKINNMNKLDKVKQITNTTKKIIQVKCMNTGLGMIEYKGI